MEQESSVSLIERLVVRIDLCTTELKGVNQSREKEQRQFDTRLLSSTTIDKYCEGRFDRKLPSGRRPLLCHDEAINRLRDLFERTGQHSLHPLRVKPSQKLTISGSRKSIYDAVKLGARDGCVNGAMTTLEALSSSWGRDSDFANATGGSVSSSLFFNDVMEILAKGDVPSEETWRDFRFKWPSSVPLVLGDTFKVATGSGRAFAKDKDVLRSTVGAAIQSLLSARMPGSENFPPYDFVSPLKTKHIVDASIQIKQANEMTIMLGDVSSFTASFRNLWAALMALLLDMENDGGGKEIIVLDVGGSLIQTDLVEVIRLYMYLGFGVDVIDGDKIFNSIGGMLGMAGIDALSKSFFSLCLSLACRSYRGAVSFVPGLGGDDYRIFLVTRKRDFHLISDAAHYVHEYVSTYIGRNKDLCVETIPSVDCDIILSQPYCKKPLRVVTRALSNGKFEIKIHSQWGLALCERMILAGLEDGSDCASSLWDTINSSTPWVPEKEDLMDGLFHVFSEFGGVGSINPFVNEKTLDLTMESIEPSGYSTKAREVLERIPLVYDSSGRAWKVPLCDKESSIRSGTLVKYRDMNWQIVTALSSERFPKPSQLYRRTPSVLAQPYADLVGAIWRLRNALDLH